MRSEICNRVKGVIRIKWVNRIEWTVHRDVVQLKI